MNKTFKHRGVYFSEWKKNKKLDIISQRFYPFHPFYPIKSLNFLKSCIFYSTNKTLKKYFANRADINNFLRKKNNFDWKGRGEKNLFPSKCINHCSSNITCACCSYKATSFISGLKNTYQNGSVYIEQLLDYS